MSLFQRAHDIVAAKADKALDAAEKPDEMLDYSYNQMLEQITRIRRALVDIAASRKQIELQETQLQHSIDHLNDQAKTALGQGREDLAREALSRKGAAQGQIDNLDACFLVPCCVGPVGIRAGRLEHEAGKLGLGQ